MTPKRNKKINGKIDAAGLLFHLPCSTKRLFLYKYCPHQKKKKLKQKERRIALFHKPTQHSSHFMRHPACSPQSSFRAVHGTHSRRAGNACGRKQKQTRKENTSLMTVCSRHPLSKEDTEDAQWSVNNTSGTAPRHPSPHGGSATHPSTNKKGTKNLKNTAAGCVCVCVCVALRASARPGRKKTRGKEMCAPPHRPSSHAHTSRLPQRAVRRGPSSCVQQARRTGPSS
ncbi:hypothetical protein ECC02_002305 [Trypanosoma cruzi]|uniref:Uncharacterized protein n=1 Tax=Trypanosoma cruzi TaxID=5693 RepID=A0A7J6YDG3_TRYCR|nr:hypothetical protein ECC02_002305 [Trypanosoma cruzi]